MSLYVLMKILESAPYRYDRGIRILTLGRLGKAYDFLVGYVENGQRVLDIGCGTGALTLRAARRGARVKGIDINPQMLEIARAKATEEDLSSRIELFDMGIAELDREQPESYDWHGSNCSGRGLREMRSLYRLMSSRCAALHQSSR